MTALQSPLFASPVATTVAELVALQATAGRLDRQRRRRSSAPRAGAVQTRQLGRGLDFAEVREYQPGDDVRMIDWNVTARTGRTHTKLFVEERERPVMLVVDVRQSMRFATRGVFKSALAERLAGVLGWTSLSARDRVGGLVFGDRWHAEIRPQAGRRGLLRVFRALEDGARRAAAEGPPDTQLNTPRGSARNAPPDTPSATAPERSSQSPDMPVLANAFRRLREVTHPGSTALIFSDFSGFDDQAERALGSLVHRLDLVGVQIVDPLDYRLPAKGRFTLLDTGRRQGGRLQLITGDRALAAAHQTAFCQRFQRINTLLARGRHLHTLAATVETLPDAAGRILSRQVLRDEDLVSA